MRLLLDTHVFLWYITADPRMPAPFSVAIREPTNEVYLSAASIWEAVIKHGLGKLPLPEPPAAYLPQQRDAHGIEALPIDEGAMTHLAGDDLIRRDDWTKFVTKQAIQLSIQRDRPLGSKEWTQTTAERMGLESSLKSRGGQKRQTNTTQ